MASYQALQRARRQSARSPTLAAIFDLVFEEATGALLVQAAADGLPPASAISQALVERLGLEAFAGIQARQHVGLCVTARLEGLGWVVDGSRVRLTGDPLFQTASLFRRAPASPQAPTRDLLQRLVSALDDEEAGMLADLLDARRKRGAPASRQGLSPATDQHGHASHPKKQHKGPTSINAVARVGVAPASRVAATGPTDDDT